VYFAVLHINFISADVILYLSCSIISQVSHPCNTVGNGKVLYTRVGTLIVATIYLQLIQN